MGAVREFLDHHFLHYNARELVAAARSYEQHLDSGGTMFVTLAGAMSTARLGRILSRMIREGEGARHLLHRSKPRRGRIQFACGRGVRGDPKLAGIARRG